MFQVNNKDTRTTPLAGEDVHLNWLNWFPFLTLAGGVLITVIGSKIIRIVSFHV